MDAKAAIEGVEKVLRNGICHVSVDCNVPLQTDFRSGRKEVLQARQSDTLPKPERNATEIFNTIGSEDIIILADLQRPSCSENS